CSAEKRREVNRERSVAAVVAARRMVVAPDARGVVDGPEMQQQALAGIHCGRRNRSAVPAGLEEAGVMDTARRRFWRERHDDPGAPGDFTRLLPRRITIQGEVPVAV